MVQRGIITALNAIPCMFSQTYLLTTSVCINVSWSVYPPHLKYSNFRAHANDYGNYHAHGSREVLIRKKELCDLIDSQVDILILLCNAVLQCIVTEITLLSDYDCPTCQIFLVGYVKSTVLYSSIKKVFSQTSLPTAMCHVFPLARCRLCSLDTSCSLASEATCT